MKVVGIESVDASIVTDTLANTLSSDSPELEVVPASVSGDPGEEVVLQCLASSNPPPAYKWFRNDDLDTVSKHGAVSRYWRWKRRFAKVSLPLKPSPG